MANELQIERDLKAAELAARHAKDVRLYHARRSPKGSKQREHDLAEASERLKKAMKPLRSWLGQATAKEPTATHEEITKRVREASKELQAQRRRLWKMMARKPKRI